MHVDSTRNNWLSVSDLTKEYGLTKQIQSSWRFRKILPYSKIGHTIRYSREKIEKLFKDAEMKK